MRLSPFLPMLLLLMVAAVISFIGGFVYKNFDPVNLTIDYYENRLKNLKASHEVQIKNLNEKLAQKPKAISSSQRPVPSTKITKNWSGPELWEEIGNKRRELGLSPVPVDELTCTLAAIRLAEIRRLGRLDDHGGFDPLIKKYQDELQKADLLNPFEFLTAGADTAREAVEGLYNTLGHRTLFTEIYKAGCAYAADGFGVVLTSK